ncbi:MAG: L,D-transpeptidase family protein [Eubacterium sp.]|nr:L,D-transpeptidase family protein [Eubacterium sp.]
MICLVVGLAVAYFTPVYLCRNLYYPGTVINGIQCGFKTPDYVEHVIHEKASDYNLEIKFRDGKEIINGDDVSLKLDYMTALQEIKANQNPFYWPTTFVNHEYKIEKIITFEEDLVKQKLDKFKELKRANMKSPKNPTIEFKDGKAVSVPGDQGNSIKDIAQVKNLVSDCIRYLKPELDLEAEECYEVSQFNVESPGVVKCVDYCNQIANLDIEYDYAGKFIAFTPEELYSTIDISNMYETKINEGKVERLLKKFSQEHDTFGKVRKFRTRGKDELELDSDDYGWLISVEEETPALYADLVHKKNIKREPAFDCRAYTYVDENNDIGDFYCEVNIGAQHMYVYQDGKMVLESDFVSGCVANGHGTPGGLYYITFKQSPAVLKGADYEVNVSYWMPFNGGIGFHDANWRGAFGGDLYYYGGSHGCVNMPYYAAEELYSIAEEGMPVIVY